MSVPMYKDDLSCTCKTTFLSFPVHGNWRCRRTVKGEMRGIPVVLSSTTVGLILLNRKDYRQLVESCPEGVIYVGPSTNILSALAHISRCGEFYPVREKARFDEMIDDDFSHCRILLKNRVYRNRRWTMLPSGWPTWEFIDDLDIEIEDDSYGL